MVTRIKMPMEPHEKNPAQDDPSEEPLSQSDLEQHRGFIKRVVRCRMDPRLAARVDVSDIVQDTFAEATRSLASYRANPDMPTRLWLRRLACHRLIMAQRKHIGAERRSVRREQRLPEKSSVDIVRDLIDSIDTPSRIVSQEEALERLRSCLDDLGEHDREIILLQIVEGLTSREAAEVIGIEEAAARKRLGRALIRLRQRFLRSLEEPP